jgi:dTDP-4-amino-4,6-dideoxygalactose transaminase
MTTNASEIGELAIFSGHPAFSEPIHVGRPNIGNRARFLERVNELLDRRWLTNSGPYVDQFEKRLAELLGVRHCIAMCNATVALGIAIRALELEGEVIIPSFTFVATAHCLEWQGITPLFCDIDPRTHNLDPNRVEQLITPRTTGIMGVHLWGRPCAVKELETLASRRGLRLLFDSAHAFGATSGGRALGNFGDAEVFSFHATKFFNSFEGGAITTNNDELGGRIRLMKNFGFAGYDNVISPGTNGKMPEISAAMGLTNLESMEQFITVNRSNYHAYQEGLDRVPGVSLISYDESEQCNYQYVVVEVNKHDSGIDRNLLLDTLHAENVLARRYFYPGCHRMEPYRSSPPHGGWQLPETEKLADRVLVLPTGTAVEPEDVAVICRIIRTAVHNPEAVTQRLATAALHR